MPDKVGTTGQTTINQLAWALSRRVCHRRADRIGGLLFGSSMTPDGPEPKVVKASLENLISHRLTKPR